MPDINLLPWRVALVERRTRGFLAALALAVGLAASGVLGTRLQAHGELARAQARVARLQQELAAAQARVAERRGWQRESATLAYRLRGFADLRNARIHLVHALDALARLLPADAWYTAISRQDGMLEITGMAGGEAGIATLMHGIETSPWFAGPVALQLRQPQAQEAVYRFQLRVRVAEAAEEQP